VSIRYERQGLKVVRVVEPVPEPAPPAYPTAGLERAAALLRHVATGLRADARRQRAWRARTEQKPPPRTVTGEELRGARQALGLSQRELARAHHVSRGLVAEIERGVRSCPPDLGAWVRMTLRTTKTEVAP
jgi:DNA-binding transcriptional regulator YiaG